MSSEAYIGPAPKGKDIGIVLQHEKEKAKETEQEEVQTVWRDVELDEWVEES
jgi:hypothetical protein